MCQHTPCVRVSNGSSTDYNWQCVFERTPILVLRTRVLSLYDKHMIQCQLVDYWIFFYRASMRTNTRDIDTLQLRCYPMKPAFLPPPLTRPLIPSKTLPFTSTWSYNKLHEITIIFIWWAHSIWVNGSRAAVKGNHNNYLFNEIL